MFRRLFFLKFQIGIVLNKVLLKQLFSLGHFIIVFFIITPFIDFIFTPFVDLIKLIHLASKFTRMLEAYLLYLLMWISRWIHLLIHIQWLRLLMRWIVILKWKSLILFLLKTLLVVLMQLISVWCIVSLDHRVCTFLRFKLLPFFDLLCWHSLDILIRCWNSYTIIILSRIRWISLILSLKSTLKAAI